MWYVRCCVYIEQGCAPTPPVCAPSLRAPAFPHPEGHLVGGGQRGTGAKQRGRGHHSTALVARAEGKIIYTTCTSSVHRCGRHGRDMLYLTVHSYKYYTYIINI